MVLQWPCGEQHIGRVYAREQTTAPATERETTYGLGLGLPSYPVAEALARLGYDWFYVDGQHYPLTYEQMALMCSAVWANGATPIVRVPWFGLDHIQRALDAGAGGVMVPVVNTPEEAAAVVQAASSRRAVSAAKADAPRSRLHTAPATYYEHANDETLVSVQLETREAIVRAEEILSVDGVDVVSVGPNDLAASFGYAEAAAWQQDEFVNAIHSAVTAAERTGKAAASPPARSSRPASEPPPAIGWSRSAPIWHTGGRSRQYRTGARARMSVDERSVLDHLVLDFRQMAAFGRGAVGFCAR